MKVRVNRKKRRRRRQCIRRRKKKKAAEKKKKDKEKKRKAFTQEAESESDASSDDSSDDESDCFAQFGFCIAEVRKEKKSKKINLKTLILLDNQSMVNIFCNHKLVMKVWMTQDLMTMKGNGSMLTTNKKAHLKNYGDVWFDERAIMNILSLKNVKKKYRITYDSEGEGAFLVHKPDGQILHFPMHHGGLHYHDTTQRQILLVQMVSENEKGFSQCQIQRAKLAKELYMKVGHPSVHNFKAMIQDELDHELPSDCG